MIQLRVGNVIKKWIEEEYAEYDNALIQKILNFTQQLARFDQKTTDSLRMSILKAMERVS
jgi:hypothetical protein